MVLVIIEHRKKGGENNIRKKINRREMGTEDWGANERKA